jgi:hypothetical protein
MPVTAAVAAAKAAAAEMLAAPIAETPGKGYDASHASHAAHAHRAHLPHGHPMRTMDERDGLTPWNIAGWPAGGSGAAAGGSGASFQPAGDAERAIEIDDAKAIDHPPHGPAPPLTVEEVDAAWAAMSARPMDASIDGLLAASESWVACDAQPCGRWRRVPALVAAQISDAEPWFCEHSRDSRHNACTSPQELHDDEIDRRINAAAALQSRAAAEADKRKRKQVSLF